MTDNYNSYWDKCWRDEDHEQLYKYLEGYHELKSEEIEIFKEHHIVKVCDAACGFGAYSLALASNGFEVHSFDISETAAGLTGEALERYGFDPANVKVAGILDTGYEDDSFDGVVAHAVLDHLVPLDAKKALAELMRITRENGLIWLSFDMAEEDDFKETHTTLEDGTLLYSDDGRDGMLFCPYDWDRIDELLTGYKIVYRAEKGPREYVVIIENSRG